VSRGQFFDAKKPAAHPPADWQGLPNLAIGMLPSILQVHRPAPLIRTCSTLDSIFD
jgi:hypothetical protein